VVLSCFSCPRFDVLYFLDVLARLSFPCSPGTVFLSWLSCPSCSVLVLTNLFYLSCLGCPVWRELSWLSCPGNPIPDNSILTMFVQSQLDCPCSHLLAILPSLSDDGFPVLSCHPVKAVLSWLSGPGSPVYLSCPCCHVQTILTIYPVPSVLTILSQLSCPGFLHGCPECKLTGKFLTVCSCFQKLTSQLLDKLMLSKVML
jgi:hypothetical protein